MKPIIGLIARVEYPGETGKLVMNERYRRTVVKYGGNPTLIMPPQEFDYTVTKYEDQPLLTEEEKEMIRAQLKNCDGILMTGGFRFNYFDLFVTEYAIENDIPLLGICLGMQVISNYKREKAWNEKNDSFINHMVEEGLAHNVTLDKESFLYSIIGKEKFMVNSRHNYHAAPNDNFQVSSVSDDNYIESIEMKDKKFIVGVQWHPEDMDDETSKKLFEAFIDCCKK